MEQPTVPQQQERPTGPGRLGDEILATERLVSLLKILHEIAKNEAPGCLWQVEKQLIQTKALRKRLNFLTCTHRPTTLASRQEAAEYLYTERKENEDEIYRIARMLNTTGQLDRYLTDPCSQQQQQQQQNLQQPLFQQRILSPLEDKLQTATPQQQYLNPMLMLQQEQQEPRQSSVHPIDSECQMVLRQHPQQQQLLLEQGPGSLHEEIQLASVLVEEADRMRRDALDLGQGYLIQNVEALLRDIKPLRKSLNRMLCTKEYPAKEQERDTAMLLYKTRTELEPEFRELQSLFPPKPTC